MGPALWITALNVKYRDFRYVIPFIVRALRLAGRVQLGCHPTAMAATLLAQPDCGRH